MTRLLMAALVALLLTPAARANPFEGARLFVDPDSDARRTARAWSDSRPDDARLLERLADQSTADWFGDWNADVESDVRTRARQVRAAGALPVFVAYNIPARDLGWHSAGGASDAAGYRAWIQGFARGLEGGPAVVVLEPDALAHLPQMPAAAAAERISLMRHAVDVLAAVPGVTVYLDAGNARWLPAAQAADLLRKVGVEKTRGFALNVSNFIATEENVAYGTEVCRLLGGGHFVVDTSRNGAGIAAGGEIINPDSCALGSAPCATSGLVDARLWVKRPGESDGARAGAPPAGTFWAEYALGLARRAGL